LAATWPRIYGYKSIDVFAPAVARVRSESSAEIRGFGDLEI
jgi:hypothetical protein